MKTKLAVAALALAASPLIAQSGDAPFVVQESGRGYSSLSEAVQAVGDGVGTILIAPGRYRQCAVQEGGSIAFVAREPGTVTFDGGICEEKAALVLRGREARVSGIIFQNLRVPDGNGAGIRLEQGNLSIEESLFRNSETALLTATDPNGHVRIDRTTFSGLGRCRDDGGCSHSLYIGKYGSLSVTRSRFEKGTGGHYLKSRARRIEVRDSSFDDSAGSDSNYMIDLSNGAVGTIAGNTFVQGRDKENYSALISVAAEGPENPTAGLTISGNDASVAPGVNRDTSFVADASGEPIRIEGNRLGPRIARFEKR